MADMGGALAGIAVLDLTQGVAGPYCTKLFVDYGAEVLKVERPGSGDPTRRTGPFFYDLVRISDVFLENNAADVVEHLRIDYETLSALNPRLVMARFPGFGISGPYRDFKGYAPTMEAVAGHTYLRGYRDSDPSWTPAADTATRTPASTSPSRSRPRSTRGNAREWGS